mgnify:CR=1 FL=1
MEKSSYSSSAVQLLYVNGMLHGVRFGNRRFGEILATTSSFRTPVRCVIYV